MTFLFPQRGGAHIPMILVYILLQPVVIRGAAFSEPKAFQFIRYNPRQNYIDFSVDTIFLQMTGIANFTMRPVCYYQF